MTFCIRIGFPVLLALLLAASASAARFFDDYVGMSLHDVLQGEGLPDGTGSSHDNATILRYDRQKLLNRTYQVNFTVYSDNVTGIYYGDAQPKTAPVLQAAADWSIFAHMGKTRREIVALYGPPQLFIWNHNLDDNFFLDCMVYNKVRLGPYLFEVSYYFNGGAVEGILLMNSQPLPYETFKLYAHQTVNELSALLMEPIWVGGEGEMPREEGFVTWRSSKVFVADNFSGFFFANANKPQDSAAFTVSFWLSDARGDIAVRDIKQCINSISERWGSEGTDCGGDINRLPRVLTKQP